MQANPLFPEPWRTLLPAPHPAATTTSAVHPVGATFRCWSAPLCPLA